LHERAESAREHPHAWLEMHGTYGDLVNEPRFAAAFGKCLGRLHADGLEAALEDYLA